LSLRLRALILRRLPEESGKRALGSYVAGLALDAANGGDRREVEGGA
jgi:hypothetical protein